MRDTGGWVHHGQGWAGLRTEGDVMFIRHPDVSSVCRLALPYPSSAVFVWGVFVLSDVPDTLRFLG